MPRFSPGDEVYERNRLGKLVGHVIGARWDHEDQYVVDYGRGAGIGVHAADDLALNPKPPVIVHPWLRYGADGLLQGEHSTLAGALDAARRRGPVGDAARYSFIFCVLDGIWYDSTGACLPSS